MMSGRHHAEHVEGRKPKARNAVRAASRGGDRSAETRGTSWLPTAQGEGRDAESGLVPPVPPELGSRASRPACKTSFLTKNLEEPY